MYNPINFNFNLRAKLSNVTTECYFSIGLPADNFFPAILSLLTPFGAGEVHLVVWWGDGQWIGLHRWERGTVRLNIMEPRETERVSCLYNITSMTLWPTLWLTPSSYLWACWIDFVQSAAPLCYNVTMKPQCNHNWFCVFWLKDQNNLPTEDWLILKSENGLLTSFNGSSHNSTTREHWPTVLLK